ncbi:MAG: hypothetical protein CMQ19_13745 [Gammaproteobacteria bacterium]|nr:hypothetical protein [Gammaproteobacteria bacterium]
MKYIFYVLSLTLVIISVYWLRMPDLNDHVTRDEKGEGTQSAIPAKATDDAQPIAQKDATQPIEQIDEAVWRLLPEDTVIPPVKSYTRQVPGAVLMEISTLRSTDWQVGDEVTYTIPQTGYVLTAKIAEIIQPVPGIQTLKSYPDETMFNHMLVTIGKENTFVSLFTPDGEFELVGNRQHGWLMPSRALGGPGNDDSVSVRSAPQYLESAKSVKRAHVNE